MIAITLTIQVFLTAVLTLWLAWALRQKSSFVLACTRIMPAGIVWAFYCVGGLAAMMQPAGMNQYTTDPSSEAIVIFTIASVTGVAVLLGTIDLVNRFTFPGEIRQFTPLIRPNWFWPVLLLSLGFHWYIVFQQISQGVYFTWLAFYSQYSVENATSALYVFDRSVRFIPFALMWLGYFTAGASRKWWLFALATEFTIFFISGSRIGLILTAILAFLALLRLGNRRVGLALSWSLALGIIFTTVISPAMQRSRANMRARAHTLLAEPLRVPFEFVSSLIVGESSPYVREQPELARVASYAAYSGAISERLLEGRHPFGFSAFLNNFQLLVPRRFAPGKQALDADAVVQERLQIGVPGRDANSNPFSDAFAYLHILGIVLVGTAAGVTFALSSAVLRRALGQMASIPAAALAVNLAPLGSSYIDYLAGLRNVVLAVLMLSAFVAATKLITVRRA